MSRHPEQHVCFHDCLDSRRAAVIQYAASLYEIEHVPAIAALNAGDQTIGIPFPDVLAATDDFDNSPMVPGIQANGVIKLDTITSEGPKLLEDAFRRQELLIGEDQAVHLLHICIQLKLKQLFVCMDEQPEVFVTDNNFLALAACLLDHDRPREIFCSFACTGSTAWGPSPWPDAQDTRVSFWRAAPTRLSAMCLLMLAVYLQTCIPEAAATQGIPTPPIPARQSWSATVPIRAKSAQVPKPNPVRSRGPG
jgi:hypothetical protein